LIHRFQQSTRIEWLFHQSKRAVREGVFAAVEADTLSIIAFQIGMYAWMALVYYKFFSQRHLEPNQPQYWLMMQAAVVFGFLTSYP
jgi:hypothetical protein